MNIFNIHPFGRWMLSMFGGGGLLTFIISHRIVLHFQEDNFYPENYKNENGFKAKNTFYKTDIKILPETA